jgi:eukaryotic-like serine/threonine-protein kinase
MSTNGSGLDRIIGAGAPVEPVEEQQVRARLRRSLFGLTVDPVKLGRFTVLQRLGAGGAGVVYAAWDPQLDRKVALKVLRVADEQDSDTSELVREAKALAKLSHPNVISVFDVVEASRGSGIELVLAMEYVDGQTVSTWLRRERPHWRTIVRVFVGAGEGLAAAHAAGLIHRDFKPSNLILGNDGRVRVLDFGLAQPVVVDDVDARRIAGTPAYMAPEQHRGEPWDARMDQYAFCVALWEAVVGEAPFSGESLGQLHAAKMEGPPTRRTKRLPAHVRRVLLRGLQPNPSDRFSSMEALLAGLRKDPLRGWRSATAAGAVLAIGVVLAWPATEGDGCTGGGERLEGVWDPGRRAAARSAFDGSGQLHAARSWQSVEEAIDGWVGRWSAAHLDACRSHALGEQSSELLDLRMSCLQDGLRELRALTDVLVDADAVVVDQSVVALAELPEVAACSDTRALRARHVDPVDPKSAPAVERVRQSVADALAEQVAGRYARALAMSESALAEAASLDHRATIAEARFALGSALDRMGESASAREVLVHAARDAQSAGADELFVRAASVLVWVLGDRNARFEEADAWAALAEGGIERLGGNTRLSADLHAARGVVAFNRDRPDEAIAHHEACITMSAEAWGEEHFKTFRCHVNLANVLNRRGDFVSALSAYRSAIAVAERSIGETHPLTLVARANVIGVLEGLGRYEEALEEGAVVIERQEAALGPAHPDLGSTLVNVASAHRAAGDLEAAVTLAERALRIQEQAWGSDNIWLATTLINLAQYRLAQGDLEPAFVAAHRALDLQQAALGDDHGDLAWALTTLGRIELARGDTAAARDALQRARRLATERLGEGHFLVGIADAHLAEIAVDAQ